MVPVGDQIQDVVPMGVPPQVVEVVVHGVVVLVAALQSSWARADEGFEHEVMHGPIPSTNSDRRATVAI
jgi:hypothetical protein